MKILASDFDDTIFFLDDEEKTNNNISKIREFVRRGNIFCIITGRNYTDLKLLLNKYNIPYSYLICEDGAKIFNNTDYCLDTTYLKKDEIEKTIKVLEENNCNYYLDDGYNETTNYNDCVKIVVNSTNEEEKEKLIKLVKEKINIHIYASRFHINIIDKSVNKEHALEKLLNLEHLNYDLVHVVGDNDNDYEMLKKFPGAVIKKHHHKLDSLNKKEYETLKDYIEELM
jgi:hypothetical protein